MGSLTSLSLLIVDGSCVVAGVPPPSQPQQPMASHPMPASTPPAALQAPPPQQQQQQVSGEALILALPESLTTIQAGQSHTPSLQAGSRGMPSSRPRLTPSLLPLPHSHLLFVHHLLSPQSYPIQQQQPPSVPAARPAAPTTNARPKLSPDECKHFFAERNFNFQVCRRTLVAVVCLL